MFSSLSALDLFFEVYILIFAVQQPHVLVADHDLNLSVSLDSLRSKTILKNVRFSSSCLPIPTVGQALVVIVLLFFMSRLLRLIVSFLLFRLLAVNIKAAIVDVLQVDFCFVLVLRLATAIEVVLFKDVLLEDKLALVDSHASIAEAKTALAVSAGGAEHDNDDEDGQGHHERSNDDYDHLVRRFIGSLTLAACTCHGHSPFLFHRCTVGRFCDLSTQILALWVHRDDPECLDAVGSLGSMQADPLFVLTKHMLLR